MRLIRIIAVLGASLWALPISCGGTGDPLYSGGVQPSPAGRVNPFEPISNSSIR